MMETEKNLDNMEELIEVIQIIEEEEETQQFTFESIEDHMNNTTFSLHHTCRTCLKYDADSMDMTQIFEDDINLSTHTHNIIDELMFMKLKIKRNDGLPQQICTECMDRLTNINTFRIICEQSQTVLKIYFGKLQQQEIHLKQPTNFEFINIESNFQHDIKEENIALINDKTVVIYNNNNNTENDLIKNETMEESITVYSIDFDNNTNHIDKLNKNEIISVTNDQTEIVNVKLKSTGKCKFCCKRFKILKALRIHEENEICRKMKDCTDCGKCFKNLKSYYYHKSHGKCFIHKEPKCPYCKKYFNIDLKQHLIQNHPKKQPYQCNICNKYFRVMENRDIHAKLHNNKNFKTGRSLEFHEQCKHDVRKIFSKIQPLRPYLCKICNNSFKFEKSLNTHMNLHSEDRTYECGICGNKFKQRSHLRTHINGVHLKLKPYRCEICYKSFSQRGELNVHIRTHTGEKPYRCSHCNRSFGQLKVMRIHMRTCEMS